MTIKIETLKELKECILNSDIDIRDLLEKVNQFLSDKYENKVYVRLSPRDYEVLRMRFQKDPITGRISTLAKTSKHFKISISLVRRSEQKLVGLLNKLCPKGLVL